MASLLLRQRRPALGTIAAAGVGAVVFYKMMAVNQAEAETVVKTIQPPKIFGGGPAFASLKLESSKEVNHNTKLLRFQFPQDEAVSGLKLTSALLTFSWPQGSWLPAVRPYTPVSKANEPGYLELLVKHYPSGKVSTHLHNLQPGDSLRFVTAIPGYSWTLNKHPSITLVAGGAGITPIYQLIQGILDNPEEKTKITLVFGVNGDADVLLKDEFDEYERRFPSRFKAVYTVSKPEKGSVFKNGYVTKELLEEVGVGKGEEGDEKVFVCGPPAMEDSLVGKKGQDGILAQLGYTKSQIYKF